MAWKANDGSEYTNRIGMVQRNASLDAKGMRLKAPKPEKPMAEPGSEGGTSTGGIEQDEHAMRLVNQLADMGYSADDVVQAMGSGMEGVPEPRMGGMPKTSAPSGGGNSPINLPGL